MSQRESLGEERLVDTPDPRQLTSDQGTLVIVADYPRSAPSVLFNYWIRPDLLCQWWPQLAEIDARLDGAYHLSWPAMEWHLRGLYTTYEAGRTLAFTWAWDHEPGDIREVRVRFDGLDNGGTHLTLTHGPYADTPSDQAFRRGHIEGWLHFLGRLAAVIETSR